jgi:SAM-dependent methyltransferase
VIAEAPGGLERASRSIASDPLTLHAIAGEDPRAGRHRGPSTFVLRAFGPDDPASLPFDLRRKLESAIARATGLRPDSALARRPGRPDCEFRVQERADGLTLFLEREITAPEPPTRPGELPRTTCRLLAEMTEPRPDDVFLDPFCGYGGIALERALASPYRFVFASDIDAEKLATVKAALSGKAFERRRKTIFPKVRDALDETAFDAGFVTAIATDPPWGLYEGGVDANEAGTLLRGFLSEAARLLAPGGRFVLLVARGAEVDPGRAFAQRECLDVLVSGKKARALRFDRV